MGYLKPTAIPEFDYYNDILDELPILIQLLFFLVEEKHL